MQKAAVSLAFSSRSRRLHLGVPGNNYTLSSVLCRRCSGPAASGKREGVETSTHSVPTVCAEQTGGTRQARRLRRTCRRSPTRTMRRATTRTCLSMPRPCASCRRGLLPLQHQNTRAVFCWSSVVFATCDMPLLPGLKRSVAAQRRSRALPSLCGI